MPNWKNYKTLFGGIDMTKIIKNIASSNRAKLLNLSRQTGRAFQELVQYFAMSRFLFRLAVSDMSQLFILKGAMLFHARNLTQARSTMDIDFHSVIKQSQNPQRLIHPLF